jgi:hypothetical protein
MYANENENFCRDVTNAHYPTRGVDSASEDVHGCLKEISKWLFQMFAVAFI